MSLVISTSWNSFENKSGLSIIEEIRGLGFNTVELNFSLSTQTVKEILSLVKEGGIKVVSIHNFCPMPEGLSIQQALPDCFSLASLDEDIRKKAVNHTKASIDTAKKLNAKVLVLHLGRVEIEDRTKDLILSYQKGLKNSPSYENLKLELIKKRAEKASSYLNQALKSLDELSCYAESRGVSLGVETRFYFREIPNFEETKVILDKFKDRNIFYWHDIGHAQVNENLGFGMHLDFLRNYSNRMIGMHLHDVSGATDHLAPLKGEFDFSILKKFVKKDTIKVIEAHQPATARDIIEAKGYLESIFNGLL